jgi:hypothetical protein
MGLGGGDGVSMLDYLLDYFFLRFRSGVVLERRVLQSASIGRQLGFFVIIGLTAVLTMPMILKLKRSLR